MLARSENTDRLDVDVDVHLRFTDHVLSLA